MTSSTDLAADLPPRRDDEPASLRQDILDELADHLHCALRRELLVGGGTSSNGAEAGSAAEGDADRAAAARRRVLERFGSPSQVARKLWLDAMREKLMLQRLMLVAMFLMFVALFFIERRRGEESVAATRAYLEQVRQADAATLAAMGSALASQREQQQRMNDQILARLETLANRLQPAAPALSALPQPAEWNRLTVKCVYDQPGGEPAAGVKLRLDGTSESTKSIPAKDETTGNDGKADLGYVKYGVYDLMVITHDLARLQKLTVHPGKDSEVEVVCLPQGAKAKVVTKLSFLEQPPDELMGKLWFSGQLRQSSQILSQWSKRSSSSREFPNIDALQLIIRPDGKCLVVPGGEIAPAVSTDPLTPEQLANEPLGGILRFARSGERYREDASWADTIEIPPGRYVYPDFKAGVSDPRDATGNSVLWDVEFPIDSSALPQTEAAPGFATSPPFERIMADLSEQQEWQLSVGSWTWWPLTLAQRIPPGRLVMVINAIASQDRVAEINQIGESFAADLQAVIDDGPSGAKRLGLLKGVDVISWASDDPYRTDSAKRITLRLAVKRDEVGPIREAALKSLLAIIPYSSRAGVQPTSLTEGAMEDLRSMPDGPAYRKNRAVIYQPYPAPL